MVWEERWHPLRREWVIVSSHRNDRPWLGETVDEGREAAWAEEIRSRLDAWQRGDVTAVSGDDFLARLDEIVSGEPAA